MVKTDKRIAIFASGGGTNAENIIRYFQKTDFFSFPIVISNRADALVHRRASSLGVSSVTLSPTQLHDGEFLLRFLREHDVDYVVLAGYLLKVPLEVVRHYEGCMLNIHPALLPKFGGKGMYGDNVHRAVKEAGEHISGITIHYVSEQYDEGSVVFQAVCDVLPTDSIEAIADKVHQLEYEHYPKVIEEVWGERG